MDTTGTPEPSKRKELGGWKGNLQFELPSPTKLKKRKKRHHPALP